MTHSPITYNWCQNVDRYIDPRCNTSLDRRPIKVLPKIILSQVPLDPVMLDTDPNNNCSTLFVSYSTIGDK